MEDEPKPAGQPQLHLTRPVDRSLKAFKSWILGMTQRLNPNAKDDMSEEGYIELWKKFWAKDPDFDPDKLKD
jgi:hypothetical protein